MVSVFLLVAVTHNAAMCISLRGSEMPMSCAFSLIAKSLDRANQRGATDAQFHNSAGISGFGKPAIG
jgi:hypothetical protein